MKSQKWWTLSTNCKVAHQRPTSGGKCPRTPKQPTKIHKWWRLSTNIKTTHKFLLFVKVPWESVLLWETSTIMYNNQCLYLDIALVCWCSSCHGNGPSIGTTYNSPFSNGPFIVASTRSLVERVKITGRLGSKRDDRMVSWCKQGEYNTQNIYGRFAGGGGGIMAILMQSRSFFGRFGFLS